MPSPFPPQVEGGVPSAYLLLGDLQQRCTERPERPSSGDVSYLGWCPTMVTCLALALALPDQLCYS